MPRPDFESWRKAEQVRDRLVEHLIYHPDVTLIDIGYDPIGQSTPKDIAVRVHTRRLVTRSALGLPNNVDGVPIILVVADYLQ